MKQYNEKKSNIPGKSTILAFMLLALGQSGYLCTIPVAVPGGGTSSSTGGGSCTTFTPPVGQKFLDYSYIGTGYGFVSSVNMGDVYIPDVTIDENKIIWASPSGGGSGGSQGSPTSLSSAIYSAGEGYTVIALDGDYTLNISLSEKAYVNIISKNRHGAHLHTPGTGWDNRCIYFENWNDVHHLNIIGFEISGGGVFIESSSNQEWVGPHHIYIADCKFHDLYMGIYCGLHAHDWTIDRCEYYNSTESYLMYAMGWHQALINSVLYNNSYFSYSLRGHYPLDETYIWNGTNTRVSSRTSRYLDPDDWTHKVINNTFASNYNMDRPREAHLVLYYNADEGIGKSEDSYLPPQNVTVANNVFVDAGNMDKKGFLVLANRGINTGAVDSVDGIFVMNNVTDKEVLVTGSGVEGIRNDQNNTRYATALGFADPSARDYSLTAGSTDLINRGYWVDSAPNSSMNGISRSQCPDVGAFEYDPQ